MRARKLARSKQSITGVTESRQDVAVCVQLTIECCRDDTNIRMFGSEMSQSFWCGNETEKANACCARALE